MKLSKPCTPHRKCFGEICIQATKFQLHSRPPLSHETKRRRVSTCEDGRTKQTLNVEAEPRIDPVFKMFKVTALTVHTALKKTTLFKD